METKIEEPRITVKQLQQNFLKVIQIKYKQEMDAEVEDTKFLKHILNPAALPQNISAINFKPEIKSDGLYATDSFRLICEHLEQEFKKANSSESNPAIAFRLLYVELLNSLNGIQAQDFSQILSTVQKWGKFLKSLCGNDEIKSFIYGCDLVLIDPLQETFDIEKLKKLSIKSNAAFVQFKNQYFYVNQTKNIYCLLKDIADEKFANFKLEIKNHNLSIGGKTLSDIELERLVSTIDYPHIGISNSYLQSLNKELSEYEWYLDVVDNLLQLVSKHDRLIEEFNDYPHFSSVEDFSFLKKSKDNLNLLLKNIKLEPFNYDIIYYSGLLHGEIQDLFFEHLIGALISTVKMNNGKGSDSGQSYKLYQEVLEILKDKAKILNGFKSTIGNINKKNMLKIDDLHQYVRGVFECFREFNPRLKQQSLYPITVENIHRCISEIGAFLKIPEKELQQLSITDNISQENGSKSEHSDSQKAIHSPKKAKKVVKNHVELSHMILAPNNSFICLFSGKQNGVKHFFSKPPSDHTLYIVSKSKREELEKFPTVPHLLAMFLADNVVIGEGNNVHIYNIKTKKSIMTSKNFASKVTCFKGIGKEQFLCGTEKGMLVRCNLKNNDTINIEAHKDKINCIEFIANDEFVTCSKDAYLKVWSYSGEKCTKKHEINCNSEITALKKINSDLVVCGSSKGELFIFDLKKKTVTPRYKYTVTGTGMFNIEAYKQYILISFLNTIHILDRESLKVTNTEGFKHTIMAMKYGQDDELFLGFGNGEIRIFDLSYLNRNMERHQSV